MVEGLVFRVQDSGVKNQGLGFRVWSLEVRGCGGGGHSLREKRGGRRNRRSLNPKHLTTCFPPPPPPTLTHLHTIRWSPSIV